MKKDQIEVLKNWTLDLFFWVIVIPVLFMCAVVVFAVVVELISYVL